MSEFEICSSGCRNRRDCCRMEFMSCLADIGGAHSATADACAHAVLAHLLAGEPFDPIHMVHATLKWAENGWASYVPLAWEWVSHRKPCFESYAAKGKVYMLTGHKAEAIAAYRLADNIFRCPRVHDWIRTCWDGTRGDCVPPHPQRSGWRRGAETEKAG